MDYKQQLKPLRVKIDEIDTTLAELFAARMDAAVKIGDIKREANLSVADPAREAEVIERFVALARNEDKSEAAAFITTLTALSKLKQKRPSTGKKPLVFPPSGERKPGLPKVFFQGIEGAFGEMAAIKIFPGAKLFENAEFEDVFAAVNAGEADFGVLPIENSHTGAIGEVYDLLRRYGCFITGQEWIKAEHCLLGVKGATLSDIREVYSHPEGFRQCSRFLKGRAWDKITSLNTAVAAKTAADKNSPRTAAIGSARAAEIRGLEILASGITDDDRNSTRFIVISKQPLYDAASDTVSVTFSTLHKSGALCAVLQIFALAGINLKRIESRPTSGGKYRFFADLEGNITDPAVISALEAAGSESEYFEILGNYS